MTQIVVREQDITLEEKALSYPNQAKQLIINNPDDYTTAGEFVKTVDGLVKEVHAAFDDNISKAHTLHKSLIAEMNRHLAPLQTAKTMARTLMISWDKEQEQKRRQEEMRLRELARKAEEEAQLAAALEAEAAGQPEEAQAIMEEEVYVPPIIIPKQTPKVEGVQFRTTWKFRIKNEGLIPRGFMLPDMVKIGSVVRATKENHGIPGIEAYSERS